MLRKTESRHISNYSFTSPLDLSRRVAIRRRLIESKRQTEQSQETQVINTSQSIRNTVSTFSRPINNDENNSLISNLAENNNNKIYITNTPSKSKYSRKRYSLHLSAKNELKKIEEEKPKEEKINSEIKDAIKCYICKGLITKPKMCQYCHRIACEKCLYNWFILQQKKNCSYCLKEANFSDMISVPFMSTVADFVEKIFDEGKKEEKDKNDFCPNHINENMHYYCLNCNKGYCKICFVFFGKEKDKHINHEIIKYEQYKNFQFQNLKKIENQINQNIEAMTKKVNLCELFQEAYEYEKSKGNIFLDDLKNEFNKYIDNNLSLINDHIISLKNMISNYDKYKSELINFYSHFSNNKINKTNSNNFFNSQKISFELINKFTKLNSEKIYSEEELIKLFDLSKEIHFNTYNTKIIDLNDINIIDNYYIKIGDTPYEFILKKIFGNVFEINMSIKKNEINRGHNYTPFVYIKLNENKIYINELQKESEDDEFINFKNRISLDNDIQSSFLIKGILYDYYFT